MALTTGQAELIDKSAPVFNDLKVGARIRYLSTDGTFGTQGTTYGTGYETSTASSTASYLPNEGIIRATATGYYTIAKPEAPNLDLTIFTQGTTDQYFRVCSAGTGAGNCYIAHGTGTTFAVFANASGGGNRFHLKSVSTALWLMMTASGTNASGSYTLTTSS